MGFYAPVQHYDAPPEPGAGLFDRLMSVLNSPGAEALLGGPMAARWITNRIVGGTSQLQGPVSKITQVPIRDIAINAADHPDAINPLKVNEIQSLMSGASSRIPALELAEDGGKLVLKDGRHRFTAAQRLGLDEVPAVIQRRK